MDGGAEASQCDFTANTRKDKWIHGHCERRRSGKKEGCNTFTYFFSEIPDNFGAREMLGVFQKYGNIKEVVIPSKRDKNGRRFGFVRVLDVRDPNRFGVELDNIIIGRDKIFVNIPRFQREQSRELGHAEKQSAKHQRPLLQNQHHRSYAHTVRNGRATRGRDVDAEGTKKPSFAHLHFQVEEVTIQRLSKAFIGRVSNPGMTYNIQEEFHRQGYFSIKVTPLGSNLVLLEGIDDEEILALINEAKDWIGNWFDEIRNWSPREVDNERLTWIRCYGTPVHAWSENFFSLLATTLGEYVAVDVATSKKRTMDVARILIKTKTHNTVNERVNVNINGEVFSIKLVEDWYGPLQWVRNCGGAPEYSSSDEESDDVDIGVQAKVEEIESPEEGEFEAAALNEKLIAPTVGNINSAHEGNDWRTDNCSQHAGALNAAANDMVIISQAGSVGSRDEEGVQRNPITCSQDHPRIQTNDNLGHMLICEGPVHETTIANGCEAQQMTIVESGPEACNLLIGCDGPAQVYINGQLVRGIRSDNPIEPNVAETDETHPQPRHEEGTAKEATETIVGTNGGVSRTDESTNFSGGTVLCCESTADSDIVRCNTHFWARRGENVEGKVWRAAKKLGIAGSCLDDDYVGKIVV